MNAKLDVGAIRLDKSVVRQLKKAPDTQFAPIDILWIDDVPDGSFGFAGYPADVNQPIYDSQDKLPPTVQRHFISFRVNAAPASAYARIGCSRETHFVAGFNHRKLLTDGAGLSELHPSGISGGAVLFYGSLDALFHMRSVPRLIGIGIEYHESEYLIAATRSTVILEVLRQLREKIGLAPA